MVKVSAQTSGRIRDLYVDYNSNVKHGEVIARIDPAAAEARLKQAEAALEAAAAQAESRRLQVDRARSEVANARLSIASAHADTQAAEAQEVVADKSAKRKTELAARGSSTDADVERAQADARSNAEKRRSAEAQEKMRVNALAAAELQLKIAERDLDAALAAVDERDAALAQARVELGYTFIYAPVDGVVIWRSVDVGQTIAVASEAPTLFWIAQDLSKMQLEANIDEADIARVKIGAPVLFTVDAIPGKQYRGAVSQIRSAPDAIRNSKSDRNQVVTYVVVAAIDNPDRLFLPGMTANAQFLVAARRDVLKVPNAALRFVPDNAQFVPDQIWLDNGRKTPVPVKVRVGITDGTYTEIVPPDGIAEGRKVVVGQVSN
jgi:HlyD family secretion protein